MGRFEFRPETGKCIVRLHVRMLHTKCHMSLTLVTQQDMLSGGAYQGRGYEDDEGDEVLEGRSGSQDITQVRCPPEDPQRIIRGTLQVHGQGAYIIGGQAC